VPLLNHSNQLHLILLELRQEDKHHAPTRGQHRVALKGCKASFGITESFKRSWSWFLKYLLVMDDILMYPENDHKSSFRREHAGVTAWRQLRGAADALTEAATLAPRATGSNGGRRPSGSTRERDVVGTDRGVLVPTAERAWVGGDNGNRCTATTMAGGARRRQWRVPSSATDWIEIRKQMSKWCGPLVTH
jgi:hypothetical protein